ncbi:unnamed protein product, partial [Tenebrio molitor]
LRALVIYRHSCLRQSCCKSDSCLNIKFYKTQVLIYYFLCGVIMEFHQWRNSAACVPESNRD